MDTPLKIILSLLVFVVSLPTISAQEYLEINTQHKCIFSGNQMDEDLFAFSSQSTSMQDLVNTILEIGGNLEQNFILIQTNVENVTAVIDGDKRYLLWSQDFFARDDRIANYAAVSHEIAHHVNEHTLTPERAAIEEKEADFFVGYIFYKANFEERDIQKLLTRYPKYRGTISNPGQGVGGSGSTRLKRSQTIKKGFQKGKNALTYKSLQFDNDASMVNFQKAQFPFPPPECHTSYELPNRMFSTCNTLGEVSKKITAALQHKNYPFRFMSVPNGYAIVTQMEQYHDNGTPMLGSKHRWLDYPPAESFSVSWAYLKSLVAPRKGYLRLFTFIVTSQNYNSSKRHVSREEASAWLSLGVNRLPKSVANATFHEDYSVSLLVYEFEVPESNHKVQQNCPCQFQAAEHFQKSGLKARF